MKKIFSFSLLFLAALSFVGCVQEEDDIFDKSAAERLNEASSLYSQRLMASPNGWAMQLYPTTENEAPYGNGYLLLIRFNHDYSADVAMTNKFTNGLYKEDRSAWEVITDNGPVLSFNTYNQCLHAFTNPEDIPFTGTRDDSNDETGTGVGGDYEFIIVDAPEDASYMMLKGKKRATYNLLTPVEEGVDYQDYLDKVNDFQRVIFGTSQPSYSVIHFGDQVYNMVDAADGIPNIYPADGDAVINEGFNPFLTTMRGDDYYIRFRDELSVGDKKVQEFRYDKDRDLFYSEADNTVYIESPVSNVVAFLQEQLEAGNVYKLFRPGYVDMTRPTISYDMSDKVSEALTGLHNYFSSNGTNKNRAVDSLGVAVQEEGLVAWQLKYNKGNNLSPTNFLYSYTMDSESITFKFERSEAPALMNSPVVSAMFNDILSRKFIITRFRSKFDMTRVLLTAADDPDIWFVLNY